MPNTIAGDLRLSKLDDAFIRLLDLLINGEFLPLAIIALVMRKVGDRWSSKSDNRVISASRIGALGVVVVFDFHLWRAAMPSTAPEMLDMTLRTLIVFFASEGFLRIGLSTVCHLISMLVVCPLNGVKRGFRNLLNSIEQVQQSIQRESRRNVPPTVLRPQDDTLRRKAEETQRQQQAEIAVRRQQEQLRREEVRMRCELLYERHARQLSSSFPRERFEAFLLRFMSDGVAAELIEQREQLLKEMIVDSLGTTIAPKFASMTELAAFFAARRLEIEELPHDEDAKDAYRIQLNKQEDEALRKLLKP